MSDTEQKDANGWTPTLLKQRRRRAAIMGIALAIMVTMFFLVTVVRLSANIAGSGQ
mgnify:FL=1|jgi:predicted tellurium resistance membrane protein TerC